MDQDELHRNNDSELLDMRSQMIDKEDHFPSNVTMLRTRVHRDHFVSRAMLEPKAHTYMYISHIPGLVTFLGSQFTICRDELQYGSPDTFGERYQILSTHSGSRFRSTRRDIEERLKSRSSGRAGT
jgi:hypothetical protein